jgi:NADH:ubiquinone oxidoreductase subunit 5 (subunit L)/multisubunit Na+/H+ antiporter MnhA subunit
MNLLTFILPVVIILTVIYCLRFVFLIFFGQANYLKDDLKVDENNKLMLFSTIILAILTVLLCIVLYYTESSKNVFEIFNPYHIYFITIGIFIGYVLYYKYQNVPYFIRGKMPNLTNFITYDFILRKLFIS